MQSSRHAKIANDNFAVFVTNLHESFTSQSLRAQFEHTTAGRVTFVKLIPNTRRAYVYFTCFSDAIRAVECNDNTFYSGKRLFVTIHKKNQFIRHPFPLRPDRPTRQSRTNDIAEKEEGEIVSPLSSSPLDSHSTPRSPGNWKRGNKNITDSDEEVED